MTFISSILNAINPTTYLKSETDQVLIAATLYCTRLFSLEDQLQSVQVLNDNLFCQLFLYQFSPFQYPSVLIDHLTYLLHKLTRRYR